MHVPHENRIAFLLNISGTPQIFSSTFASENGTEQSTSKVHISYSSNWIPLDLYFSI